MPKRTGQPNGRKSPWKHEATKIRREAAETRQKAYNLLTFEQKFERAGTKQKAKLLAKKA